MARTVDASERCRRNVRMGGVFARVILSWFTRARQKEGSSGRASTKSSGPREEAAEGRRGSGCV